MNEASIEITDEEGAMLVRLAREAIEKHLSEKRIIKTPAGLDEKFYRKMGVFVTLNTHSRSSGEGELRGCIGQPLPERPLLEALIDSAISSAVHDPRFEKVAPEEINSLVVEISVLTPPQLITVKSPSEYSNHIHVGEDGLIIRWSFGAGLLLPQVAVEYNWSAEEFLCHCCMKAGAAPDHWHTQDAQIYKFQALVFNETEPNGQVTRRVLE
jgi:uncharacterized protein (TIGR00296 family)